MSIKKITLGVRRSFRNFSAFQSRGFMQGNLVWHQVKKEQIIKRRIWLFSATLIISWSPLILFHTVRFFQLGLKKDLCNNLYKLTSIGPYLRFIDKNIFLKIYTELFSVLY